MYVGLVNTVLAQYALYYFLCFLTINIGYWYYFYSFLLVLKTLLLILILALEQRFIECNSIECNLSVECKSIEHISGKY